MCSCVKCQGLSFSGCAAVCVSGFEFQWVCSCVKCQGFSFNGRAAL